MPAKKPRRPAGRKPAAKAAAPRKVKATRPAANKTLETSASVAKFLAGIKDPWRAADCQAVLALMAKVTGAEPRMWGSSIVGFGSYHYVYESGREGDMLRTGFSPRKEALTLYLMGGFPRHAELMARLGKYKTGKSCLYIKRLEEVDLTVLESLVRESWKYMAARYPDTP